MCADTCLGHLRTSDSNACKQNSRSSSSSTWQNLMRRGTMRCRCSPTRWPAARLQYNNSDCLIVSNNYLSLSLWWFCIVFLPDSSNTLDVGTRCWRRLVGTQFKQKEIDQLLEELTAAAQYEVTWNTFFDNMTPSIVSTRKWSFGTDL